jgi:hypothetical protein
MIAIAQELTIGLGKKRLSASAQEAIHAGQPQSTV